MKSLNECIKIAQNACIDMFGKDFVDQHKHEFCSLRYENKEQMVFEYSLLWAPFKDKKEHEGLRIGGEPFDYYASVIVNMITGVCVQDPDPNKTKLPS